MFHIERDGHHSNYTCISNDIIMDKRLSLAARGFLAAVLSLPDDWDFSVNGMARLVGVNKDTVLRYIRELEELGYVRIESKDEIGRYARKSYTFYENTVPKNTAPKITVPKNTAQSNTNMLNTKYKQNTISIDQDDEQKNFSFLEKQTNADMLRAEYGTDYIDKVVEVITDCMKAKSRTISGESVDNPELQRVFGEVNETDIRKAIQAVKGKRFDNFAGYFGSVLFNQIKNRLDKPQLQPKSDSRSSIQMDEVMRSILEKYRGVNV